MVEVVNPPDLGGPAKGHHPPEITPTPGGSQDLDRGGQGDKEMPDGNRGRSSAFAGGHPLMIKDRSWAKTDPRVFEFLLPIPSFLFF
jgi:hypothetical protein